MQKALGLKHLSAFRDRYLAAIIGAIALLLISVAANAQYFNIVKSNTQMPREKIDSAFYYPTGCGIPDTTSLHGTYYGQSAIYFDSCGGRLYVFNPHTKTWSSPSPGSGVWGSITGTISDQTDLQSILNQLLPWSDTAAMLAPYLRKADAAALYYPLSNPNLYISNVTGFILPGQGVGRMGTGISGDPYVISSPLIPTFPITIEPEGTADSARDITLQIDPGPNGISVLQGGISVQPIVSSGPIGIGPIITWTGVGYIYHATAGDYKIGDGRYHSNDTTITLDAPDGSFDRFDIFVGNDHNQIAVVKGIPALPELFPAIDPATQLQLSFANVQTGTTTPAINTECAYIDNTGNWVGTVSNARVNLNNVTGVCQGTKSISFTAVRNGDNVVLTRPGGLFDPRTSNSVITFQIKSTAAWAASKHLTALLRNGTTPVGTAVTLSNNTFGFVSDNTCRTVAWPITLFGLPATASVDNIIFTAVENAGTFGFQIDDICFQGQSVTPPINTANFVLNAGGVPKAKADITANRPVASAADAGAWFVDITKKILERDNGTGYDTIGSGAINADHDVTSTFTGNTLHLTVTGLEGVSLGPLVPGGYLYDSLGFLVFHKATDTTFYFKGGTGDTLLTIGPHSVTQASIKDSLGFHHHINLATGEWTMYSASGGSQTLDQTLGFGDTSFNKSMAFKDGLGQIMAFIEPSAKLIAFGNAGDMGALVEVNGQDSNIVLQAYNGMTFLGNIFGGPVTLLTQSSGSADNIYFPATGNANDTLATLFDISLALGGGSGGPFLPLSLATPTTVDGAGGNSLTLQNMPEINLMGSSGTISTFIQLQADDPSTRWVYSNTDPSSNANNLFAMNDARSIMAAENTVSGITASVTVDTTGHIKLNAPNGVEVVQGVDGIFKFDNTLPVYSIPDTTAGALTYTDAASGELRNVYWNDIKTLIGGGTPVTSVTGTANRITSSGGTTPAIDISASYVGQTSLTTLGTIATGTWHGTKIGLAFGGTNADLSATGGTANYLKQASSGAAITVGTIPESDLTFTNITTNNVSTTKHGFAPILPNDATKYLDGTGAYTTPAGTGVATVVGTTNRITSTGGTNPAIDISATFEALLAKLASPTFTGTPTLPTGTIATTQSPGNNTTAIATTAYSDAATNLKANIASPTFTGTPAAPTQAADDSTTALATDNFVRNATLPANDMSAFSYLGSAIKAQPVGGTYSALNSSTTLGNQAVLLQAVYVPERKTYSGGEWVQNTKGSYTGTAYNGIGVYSINAATGTLTLLASSTTDATIWQTATSGTLTSKAFSATITLTPGVYYFAALWNESAVTTAPKVTSGGSTVAPNTIDFPNSIKLVCQLTSQTSLPSTIAMSATAAVNGYIGFYLY